MDSHLSDDRLLCVTQLGKGGRRSAQDRTCRFPTKGSACLRREPRRRDQTRCNQGRKNYWGGEGVPPAQSRDCDEANGERPRNAAHAFQSLCRKSPQQPRQYRREQKKHGEEKPERAEEVPIGPAEPLRVKADGPHQPENRVRPPLRIILAKPKRMSRGKKQQKNGEASDKEFALSRTAS